MTAEAALRALVDQIERSAPVDDHGHDLRMNQAFLNAKALLNPPAPVTPQRREYRLSDQDHADLLEASRPVPYLIANGTGPRSPFDAAMDVWRRIGEREGFDVDSVKQVPGKGDGWFSAITKARGET